LLREHLKDPHQQIVGDAATVVAKRDARIRIERTATGKYRTTPLRALWQHASYFTTAAPKTLPRSWTTMTGRSASI
jgi:hypothetical protein